VSTTDSPASMPAEFKAVREIFSVCTATPSYFLFSCVIIEYEIFPRQGFCSRFDLDRNKWAGESTGNIWQDGQLSIRLHCANVRLAH